MCHSTIESRKRVLGRYRDYLVKMCPMSYKDRAGEKWHSCSFSFNLLTQFVIASSAICWPPIKSHRVSPQECKNRQISFSTVQPGGQNSSFTFACSLIHFLMWLHNPRQSYSVLSDKVWMKSSSMMPLKRDFYPQVVLSGEYRVQFVF